MGRRDAFLCERDLNTYRKRHGHLFPTLETTPDLSRYQTRLAAEVALTVIGKVRVNPDQATAFEAARIRAFETLSVLAKG